MKRFFGRLLVLPVRLLAEAVGLLRIFDLVPLWSIIWRLSGDADDGCRLISLVFKRDGIERARKVTEEAIDRTRDSQVAARMGLLEFFSRTGTEAINKWVRIANDGNYKNPDSLLYLKLFLSEFLEEYNREKIVEEIMSRDDLPALTKLAGLAQKANDLLEEQRWEQAEEIADFILGISEQVNARVVKWVVCLARGDEQGAKEHFIKAQGKLPDGVFNLIVAQGHLFLGDINVAMEWLRKADIAENRIREWRGRLGDLARSQEFEMFCMERSGE